MAVPTFQMQRRCQSPLLALLSLEPLGTRASLFWVHWSLCLVIRILGGTIGSKTWRAFWANSRLLLNERVSLRRCLRVWSSCVASVFLWGLAALTFTLAMLRTVDICQREMIAKIMRRRRRPVELCLDWHVCTRRLAGRLLAECQILPISILSLKRRLNWAGHLRS